MKYIYIFIVLGIVSCSNNNENSNSENTSLQKTNIDSEVVNSSKNDIEDIFAQWEAKLISEQIFDYVTESDCADYDKMMKLYENGKYPMHTTSKSFLKFDYNNDGIQDYVIKYSLENCVQGNGWASDFVFVTSENGNLVVNEKLTNILKKKYFDFVREKYGEDAYVQYNKIF
jgi:hypothetical protein